MTSEINGYDCVLLGEMIHLCIPIASITTPAMDKDESRLASTKDLERYGNPIS
jgi:hypothetical protein